MTNVLDNHVHSVYLDFDEDVVKCSKFCGLSLPVAEALKKVLPEARLDVVEAILPSHHGKAYVVSANGVYWCAITGYTRGVLHLLEFKPEEYYEVFKKAVSKCFGALLVQIDFVKKGV